MLTSLCITGTYNNMFSTLAMITILWLGKLCILGAVMSHDEEKRLKTLYNIKEDS